jgi:MFS family permease
MEPSDKLFARSYHFLDEHGENIPLRASIGGSSWTAAGGGSLPHHRRQRKTLMSSSKTRENQHESFNSSASSVRSIATRWSDNTLVQSVLMADGLYVPDVEVETSPEQLPSRYSKANVKSKATWFGALCLAGIGMFVEAYVIITTGQIKTIWHSNYPTCWEADKDQPCPNKIQCCDLFPNTPNTICQVETPNDICTIENNYSNGMTCTEPQVGGVSYAEFAGIMIGMLTFGTVADRVGRKQAGTLTSIVMIAGIGGMTFFDSDNISTLFVVFSCFFAVFGFGVGGEYPLTATQAAEHHAESAEDALQDDEETRHHRLLMEKAKTARRGETISLVFAMQGVGAVVGSLLLLSLIFFSGQGRVDCYSLSANSRGTDVNALETIWRSFYLIGLIMVCMLFIYRSLVLEEGDGYAMMAARKERRETKHGKDVMKKRWWHIFWFYTPRLLGTGGNWFVWDVTFYGLKLFSGPIFDDINPGGDLMVQNGYLLINNICALVGYYCAARVIDNPFIGRKRLQMFSFAVSAILFMATAAVFDTASSGAIMFLFFASSFFGNFGANVTTYVMAAETYPTELRGTFHGLSAFLGKAGALFANIGFTYLSTDEIFWACGACAITGFFLTYVFSVDLTGVSLAEHDALLELLYANRVGRYRGKLNEYRHLSNFEIWTGWHGEYDQDWVRKLIADEEKTMHPIHLPGEPSLDGKQKV